VPKITILLLQPFIRMNMEQWTRQYSVTIDDGIGGGRRNFKVVQKLAALRPVYEIYDEQTGERLATGRRTWLSFLRSTIHFEDEQGNRILTAKGGFFDKTFWLLDETMKAERSLRSSRGRGLHSARTSQYTTVTTSSRLKQDSCHGDSRL